MEKKKKKTARTARTVNTGNLQAMKAQLDAGYSLQSKAQSKSGYNQPMAAAGRKLVSKGIKSWERFASQIRKKK